MAPYSTPLNLCRLQLISVIPLVVSLFILLLLDTGIPYIYIEDGFLQKYEWIKQHPCGYVHVPNPVTRMHITDYPEHVEFYNVSIPFDLSDTDVRLEIHEENPTHPFEDIYKNQEFQWIKIRNAHAFQYGGVFLNDTVYYVNITLQDLWEKPDRSLTNYTEFKCDIAFNFHHKWTAYGHNLLEYFPILTMIAPAMRRRAHFIVREMTHFIANAAPLFDIPIEHVTTIEDFQILKAKEIYMITPLYWQIMSPLMLLRMREIFAKKLNLDKEIPYRYVLYNKKRLRKMLNIRDLQFMLERDFQNTTFEIFWDKRALEVTPELQWADRLFYYNQMVFSIGMHGSGHLNAIFMQEKTVLFVIETAESWESIFITIAKTYKLSGFFYKDRTFPHWKSGHNVPWNSFYKIIKAAVEKAQSVKKTWTRPNISYPHDIPLLQLDGTIRIGH